MFPASMVEIKLPLPRALSHELPSPEPVAVARTKRLLAARTGGLVMGCNDKGGAVFPAEQKRLLENELALGAGFSPFLRPLIVLEVLLLRDCFEDGLSLGYLLLPNVSE